MPGPAQVLVSPGDGYPWRDLPTSVSLRIGYDGWSITYPPWSFLFLQPHFTR